MGAILELVDKMFTPIGFVVTIGIIAGIYYFVRWLMKD
ncbi:hypothetical protein NOC27_2005 [Nitrosococcus oceani AFC27]|uniref:Uncharacterized protein n=1 Tax=Nitrosococcus watsoni (strain C-113) TaxID=105559 RepID=D8KB49_NITWC|nr:conserved hypothetical protein [Nitrosococcus watsonii C-113]EDZ65327.1 hypothetical protein NOC27_2005 [Nitrosococcus oceani AFC27]